MTSLIDTIEAAFIRMVETSDSGDSATCTEVVEAIEQYCKVDDDPRGSLEAIVLRAYLEAERVWGQDWRERSDDVAARVCEGLRSWITTPGVAT